METIAISIDQPLLKAVDRLRKNRKGKISRSEMIRDAVRTYIEELERREVEAKDRATISKHRKSLNSDAARMLADQEAP